MLLQLLSASATARDGDASLLPQLMHLQQALDAAKAGAMLLTDGLFPYHCYSCTLALQTVREMLLYTFELKNKKVEPQVRPCVGVGGLVCASRSFGSSKGSQCSIGLDSSTPSLFLAGLCCAFCSIAHF